MGCAKSPCDVASPKVNRRKFQQQFPAQAVHGILVSMMQIFTEDTETMHGAGTKPQGIEIDTLRELRTIK